MVHMHLTMNGAVKMLLICVDCDTPEVEGTFVRGLIPKHINENMESVTGILAYSIPNFADKPKILNKLNLQGRIAFVERGKISLLDKILKLQDQVEGLLGIVIADDGQCYEDFSYCGPRAGSAREGGFSSHDDEYLWRKVNIPVFMITLTSANKIRDLMKMRKINIPRLGIHNGTMVRNAAGVYEEL